MNSFLIAHLVFIVPVLVLGPWILLQTKGDAKHRQLGRTWAAAMILSCIFAFGVKDRGGLSWLHGLAAFTIFSVARAVLAIRKKDIRTHQRSMIGAYIGSLIAFLFSLQPHRLIGSWLRSLPQ